MTSKLSPELLTEAKKLIDLQSILMNIKGKNIDNIVDQLISSSNFNLFQFVHNVFIAAEYRPFSIPDLINLCLHIKNLKPLLLQILSNPKILNIEQMYFLSVCRDAGIISDEEVKEAVYEKTYDEELFKSCFYNTNTPELIPLKGEDIEDAIRADSVPDLEKCFANNQFYQIDYRIRPSIQFGCHFLRSQPTLIQYSAFCGSINIFKYLLENGANIDLKDLQGRTLAQFAMAGGNKEIIGILKSKRVDFVGTMKFAARFHRNDLFEFIDDDPIPILHHCTASNNVDLILKCLDHGSNVNQPDLLNSNTPIEIAAQFNSLDALQIYLHHRLVNVNAKNKDGQTALHIASSNDFIEFVRLLIENEFVQQRITDLKGRMPIHVASENGHVDIVELFLSKGCVTVNARTDYGATPLHMALESGDIGMIEYLLDVEGVDAEAKTLTFETPLHCAAQHRRSKAAHLLLAHDIDPNPQDKDGWTPLHYSTQNCDPETIEILLSSEKTKIDVKNSMGLTPLHLAAKMGNTEIVDIFLNCPEKSLDINIADKDGWTALHFAAKSGNPEVVNSILSFQGQSKVNINAPDNAGWTPLHDAVKYQNHDIVEILLKQDGINVNAKTKSYWVPLHIAYLNHDQKTKDMLEAMPGIIKDAKDSEGRTPEDLGKIPMFGSEENEGSSPKMIYFNGC